MRGDTLVSIDGAALQSAEGLRAILEAREPGEALEVVVQRPGGQRTSTVTLGGDGNLRWVVEPVASPGERQIRLREDWLASLAAP